MIRIFDFIDYKEFVLQRILILPNGGNGAFRKIALALRVQPSLISQVFRGPRDIDPDQACRLSNFFELNEEESTYLITLVMLSRASSDELKKLMKSQVELLRFRSLGIDSQEVPSAPLSQAELATFYSHWHFSAIMQLCAVSKTVDVAELCQHLNLSQIIVQEAIEFLLTTKLCVRIGNKIEMGPNRTWLDRNSPWMSIHHLNWRLKGIDRLPRKTDQELFFTMPMSLSREDANGIRLAIQQLISNTVKVVECSKSEQVSCLNIDWFAF